MGLDYHLDFDLSPPVLWDVCSVTYVPRFHRFMHTMIVVSCYKAGFAVLRTFRMRLREADWPQ